MEKMILFFLIFASGMALSQKRIMTEAEFLTAQKERPEFITEDDVVRYVFLGKEDTLTEESFAYRTEGFLFPFSFPEVIQKEHQVRLWFDLETKSWRKDPIAGSFSQKQELDAAVLWMMIALAFILVVLLPFADRRTIDKGEDHDNEEEFLLAKKLWQKMHGRLYRKRAAFIRSFFSSREFFSCLALGCIYPILVLFNGALSGDGTFIVFFASSVFSSFLFALVLYSTRWPLEREYVKKNKQYFDRLFNISVNV